jgi:hypothetical protein
MSMTAALAGALRPIFEMVWWMISTMWSFGLIVLVFLQLLRCEPQVAMTAIVTYLLWYVMSSTKMTTVQQVAEDEDEEVTVRRAPVRRRRRVASPPPTVTTEEERVPVVASSTIAVATRGMAAHSDTDIGREAADQLWKATQARFELTGPEPVWMKVGGHWVEK